MKSTQILEEIYRRLADHYGPQSSMAGSLGERVTAALFPRKPTEALLGFLRRKIEAGSGPSVDESPAELREELMGLKGFGPSTADALLLGVFGYAVFPIDVHAYRVLTRHALAAEDSAYEDLQAIASSFPTDLERYRDLHALFSRVGRDFCRSEPNCEGCPLNGVNW